MENRRAHPLWLQNRRRKAMGKIYARKVFQRSESAFEETLKTVHSPICGKCTNPSCNCWHPPVRQNCQTESGCKFGEKCVVRHTHVHSQPNRKQNKSGGIGSVALLKNSKPVGCVFQDTEPSKSKSILHQSVACNSQKVLYAT